MQSSDAHLERALSEYNERINTLEYGPVSVELVDALQKRGKVLSLMGYGTSAAEDFTDAFEYLEELLGQEPVPAELCIRVYAAYGSIFCDSEPETMCSIYHKIVECIPDLRDPVPCARICLRCAEDLYEIDETGDCDALLKVALSSKASDDINGRNVYFDALRISGYLAMDIKQYQRAASYLNDAARTGASLLDDHGLYDATDYAYVLVDLSGCLMEIGDRESARIYLDTIDSLLEDKQFTDRIDGEELSEIHGLVGKSLMELGDVSKAEIHLLRQAAYSLGGNDSMLKTAIEQKIGNRNPE